MLHKIYYDATNNKEVVDVSGTKTDAEIEAMGLTASKQMVQITNPDYAHEVVNGILQIFNAKQRTEAAVLAKEIARQEKEDAMKIVLGLTDTQWADLKEAMGK